MTFTIDLLPSIAIKRTDSETGRTYETPEGNNYQSITSLLSKQPNSALDSWRVAVGPDEANRISRKAATRGTILHKQAELYLLNKDIKFKNFLEKMLFDSFKPLLNRIDNIRLLEGALYSDILRLAGTVDGVAEFDGVLSIIDFKTANSRKEKSMIENYFIQVTAYSYMVEERYNLRIPNIAIMIAVDNDKPQLFIENRNNWKSKLKLLLQGNIHVQ